MSRVRWCREGDGRTAFIPGNLIVLQKGLPLDGYDERRHRSDSYAACGAGRLHGDYSPRAVLTREREEEVVAKWEETVEER